MTEPRRFYITTAIDYPNSVPHMGHAYEKTVADFYARWYRLRGFETRFLTGLDEHGQKIEEAATQASQTTQEFVDEKAVSFRNLCQKLEISNDDFIRTSEPRHHKFAAELWSKVEENGDIYLDFYEGEYCISCEAYYAENQLEEGRCPVHHRPTERLKEESYFFRLGKYREWIRDHIRRNPNFIYPPGRRNEILVRLEEEVRDLSISRSAFDWGISVPGNSKHVMYVWFDALSNYLSALKAPEDLYERFWPADVHVIGKDIIWFHSVIWPCMLHSAGLAIPRQIYAHGFILDQEGRKMAKHLGNVVDPHVVMREFGPDVLRYYFVRAFSSGHDGRFSLDDLKERYHGELGNDLGNLVLRVVKLVEDRLGGSLSSPAGVKAELDPSLVVEEYAQLVEAREQHRAMECLWAFIRRTNGYLNDRAPWKESDRETIAKVLYNALEALRGISYLLSPVMPSATTAIASQLGFQIGTGPLPPFGEGRFQVRREKPLFPRSETKNQQKGPAPTKAASSAAAAAKVDPFSRLDIRVGRINQVEEHPDAESLYVFEVQMEEGEAGERRTICAGLRQHIGADELRGCKVIVLANLKPAKLRGIESRGMVLASERSDRSVVPIDPGDAPVGDAVTVEGIEPRPKKKLSLSDFEKAALAIKNGQVVYGDKPLKTSTGNILSDVEDGAPVR